MFTGLTVCTRISTHLSIIASTYLSTPPPRHLKWLRDLQWGNTCLPPANVPRLSTVGQTCASYQPHANMYTYIHSKVLDSCAFMCLSASFQYLPVYQMIYALRFAYPTRQGCPCNIKTPCLCIARNSRGSSPGSSSSPGEYHTCQNELPVFEYPSLPGIH